MVVGHGRSPWAWHGVVVRCGPAARPGGGRRAGGEVTSPRGSPRSDGT
ncbi:hypothetical protein BN2537_11091 [Streptomyces venezuelae]|nr:hypothetical protein BN2537_11091 [Streptomyces venezuelae]